MIYTIFPVVFALLLVQKEHRLTTIETMSRVLNGEAQKAQCIPSSTKDNAILLAVLPEQGKVLQLKSSKLDEQSFGNTPEGSKKNHGIPAEAADLSAYMSARFLPDKRLAYTTVETGKEEKKNITKPEKDELSWLKDTIKFANVTMEELAEKLTVPQDFQIELSRLMDSAKETLDTIVIFMKRVYHDVLDTVEKYYKSSGTYNFESAYYWMLVVGFLFVIWWLHRFLLFLLLLTWDVITILCSQGVKAVCFTLKTIKRVTIGLLLLPFRFLNKLLCLIGLRRSSCHSQCESNNINEEISANTSTCFSSPKDPISKYCSTSLPSTSSRNETLNNTTREVGFYRVEDRDKSAERKGYESGSIDKKGVRGEAKHQNGADYQTGQRHASIRQRGDLYEDKDVFYDTVWDTERVHHCDKRYATSTPRPSQAPPIVSFDMSSSSLREQDASLTPKKLQRFLHEQYNRLRALGISFHGSNLDYLNLTGASCAPDFMGTLDSFVENTRFRIKRKLLNMSAIV